MTLIPLPRFNAPTTEEAVKQTQEAIYSTINLINQNILALAELENKLNEVLKNGNV